MPLPWLRIAQAIATCAAAGAVSAAPALARGDQIAYRCDVDICIVDPDAPAAVTNLTDNGTTSLDGTPAWSPDGSKVAFVSTFGAGGRNVFVMDPDAQGNALNLATQLTFYPNVGGFLAKPVWSRDGTKVAFERNAGVFVVNSDGTTVTPVTVTADGAHPTWSPDGTSIAFSKGEQVYLASAAGGGTPVPLANGGGHDPVWSPDGTRIAFDAISPIGHDPFVDLHVVRVDGSGTPVVTPINYTQWTFAAWSPDGTTLAYRSTTGNDGHIRVVRGDGTRDMGLASAVNENDYEPVWSPDGARVAFHGYRYSLTDPTVQSNEVYVAKTSDGSGVPQVVTTGGKNYEPAWRPDPLRTPFVPILTPPGPAAPAPAAGSPAPAPARRPTVVWITKRIPYVPGSLNLFVGNYGCGGPACSVNSTGTAKGGTKSRGASAAAKKRKPKPKAIVVGRGKMVVPADSTRPLKLKLTRAGIALLRSRGNLTITVTVVTTGAARPRTTETKQVRVRYVRPKPKR